MSSGLLLMIAAAVTVYGIAQAATVSHPGSEIVGKVGTAGQSDNSDLLQGLSAADIIAAGGGGKFYKTVCHWSCAASQGYYLGRITGTWLCTSSCEPPICATGDTSLSTGCVPTSVAAASFAYHTTGEFAGEYNINFGSGYGYFERVCRDE